MPGFVIGLIHKLIGLPQIIELVELLIERRIAQERYDQRMKEARMQNVAIPSYNEDDLESAAPKRHRDSHIG